MDLHYKQEVSVGLLVIAAVVLFSIGLAWLSGVHIGPQQNITVSVRFTDVLGLRVGDAVQTSGVKVGRVEDVVLQEVGRVMVNLTVRAENRPHSDARAQVGSLDFLGNKFVDYSPGRATDFLPAGQSITGAREIALTEGAAGLAQRATEAIASAQSIFNERTAEDIHATMIAAKRALDVFSQLGTGPQIKQASEAVRALQVIATRLDSILSNPSLKKSLDRMDDLTGSLNEMSQKLTTTTQSLSSILKKVDEGKGTLGKAATDTALYHNLNETLLKTQRLLDDIRNNPGRYINVKVF
jgi:phospholipid/cholesterol/gamma-HCH transport system substrate-binding protein